MDKLIKVARLGYTTSNLGDDIQAIASEKFLPHNNIYFNRDLLSDYESNERHLILLNGWFSGNPIKWPPKDFLIPIITSFHISHKNDSCDKLLSKENINYFLKHQPIGCRDYWTLKLLQQKSITAYFSGCLTLTLEKDPVLRRNNKILLVDAFHDFPLDFAKFFIKHLEADILSSIEISTHWNTKLGNDNLQRRNIAMKQLKELQTARLVITSRLHCVLPCLAYGTPVYFIDHGFDSIKQRNRFGGLLVLADKLTIKNPLKFLRSKRLRHLSKLEHIFLRRKLLKVIDWGKDRNFKQDQIDKTKRRIIETTKKHIAAKLTKENIDDFDHYLHS